MTLEIVLACAEKLRQTGATGALLALMAPDCARELGLEDGAVLERGRKYTYARIDFEVPAGTIVVAALFPDPREAIRKHAAAAAEGR